MKSNLLNCPKYGEKLTKVADKIKALKDSAKATVRLAESEKRDLTRSEAAEIDRVVDESIPELERELNRLTKLRAFDDSVDHSQDGEPLNLFNPNQDREYATNSGRELKDVRGNTTARVYAKGEKYVKSSTLPDTALGTYAKCVYDGNFEAMRQFGDTYAALTTTSNVDGGVLVPEEMSGMLVDLARANSVLFQAGAQLMEMQSDRMTVATVTGDPTWSTTGEGAEIAESSITFGNKAMTLVKRAALIKVSRELMEDASNIDAIISETLTRAYAAELDNFLINGVDGPFYSGLLDDATISGTGSIGGITWEDVSAEVTTMKANNEMPGAYIIHPTIAGDLDELTTGDGSTSAKGWLGAPPTLEGVSRFGTTNMPTSDILIGDFSKLAIGMKPNNFRLEVSTDAEFTKDMVLIKLVYRVDHAVLRSTAFRKLSGITT